MRARRLLVLFARRDRELGREVLDTAADAGWSWTDRIGIAWYALRRRCLLGPGQHIGDALDWAAAPGIVLSGVLAIAAFGWQEWAPNAGPLVGSTAHAHRGVAPFLTTGAYAFPVFAVASLLAVLGHRAAARAAAWASWAAAVGAQVAVSPVHGRPGSSVVLLVLLTGLQAPALLAPRVHRPAWRSRALAAWAVAYAAVLLAIHLQVTPVRGETNPFVSRELAQTGARVYDVVVPVLLVLAVLVASGRTVAARGAGLLLVPFLPLVAIRSGFSVAAPEVPLLLWAVGASAVVATTFWLPDRQVVRAPAG